MSKKLSKTQQELLDAMNGGVVVCLMLYKSVSYFSRNDTGERCTAAAKALLAKGLVEAYDTCRGYKLRPKANNATGESE